MRRLTVFLCPGNAQQQTQDAGSPASWLGDLRLSIGSLFQQQSPENAYFQGFLLSGIDVLCSLRRLPGAGTSFLKPTVFLSVFRGRNPGQFFKRSVKVRHTVEAAVFADMQDGVIGRFQLILREIDPLFDDIVPHGKAVKRFEHRTVVGAAHAGFLRQRLQGKRFSDMAENIAGGTGHLLKQMVDSGEVVKAKDGKATIFTVA